MLTGGQFALCPVLNVTLNESPGNCARAPRLTAVWGKTLNSHIIFLLPGVLKCILRSNVRGVRIFYQKSQIFKIFASKCKVKTVVEKFSSVAVLHNRATYY